MRIGLFCSGGDAPGMNACTRAIVRSALSKGHEVVGILRGYQGLLEERFYSPVDMQGTQPSEKASPPLFRMRDVSGWSNVGGAFLYSSRSEEFRQESGQKRAAAVLNKYHIDALIPIGGNGTCAGAMALSKYWNGQIIGCPGTIDNDLFGTDYTIGFSSAVGTAVEAVDKVRTTAESHQRMFLIEVMGRHSGYICLYTALAAGCEMVCIPETLNDYPGLIAHLHELKERGKKSIMLVVAEGDEGGGVVGVKEALEKQGCPYPMRLVILGHLLRGGSPTPGDRILASRLGDYAVTSILSGETGAMAGEVAGQLTLTSFEKAVTTAKPIPQSMLDLLETLSS
ncbi:MAG: ATP-dependent 6-phosphofructokinase [Pirellulaceae bacterium]|nr:ATP-dependent 6-phosphofructokinase [Pirellulaceae bacterium]